MAALGMINRLARAVVHGAIARGWREDAVCRLVDITPAQLHSAQLVFNPESFARSSQRIKRLMNDEFCGLTRHPCKTGTITLMCELVLPSRNLGEALDKAFRFYRAVTDDIRFDLRSDNKIATVEMTLAEPARDPWHYLGEWFPLFWRHFASWLIAEEIPVLCVSFTHPPCASPEEYAQTFGEHCLFEQERNFLRFDVRYLSRRIVKTEAQLQEFLSLQSFDLVTFGGAEPSVTTQLRSLLRAAFLNKPVFPTMAQAAAELHVSEQTLRRRLGEEGVSYRKLKEEIRRELAMMWLRDPQIPIAEVSRLSGFAETNGLSRAVRTWAGLSPSDYRKSIVAAREQLLQSKSGHRTSSHRTSR